MTTTLLLTLLLLSGSAQESTRTLDKPGEHFKHLTIDTVDRWLLEGVEDEVLRVDVRSSDFDPVLELVRVDGDGRTTEVLIPEVDDDGSQSHMLLRLPSGGPIAILVHGPKHRGGGRYRLYVERLKSKPLPAGAEYFVGRLDRKGNAHVRVMAQAGEVIVPRGAGVIEVIDPKGYSLGNWRGCYAAQRDGEHYLRVRGKPKASFRVGLATVPRRVIRDGSVMAETIEGHGLHEWTFDTHADGLQHIELFGDDLEMRIVPFGEAARKRLDDGPALRWIPTHSKGRTHRAALIARVAIAQKIQIRSSSDRPLLYRVALRDPTVRLPIGARSEGALAVGGSDYWTFDAEPGQVLRIDVNSLAFDPVLKLYDSVGVVMIETDDSGADLGARHSWLVTRRGQVHAEVRSFGNGGGGAYSIELSSLDMEQVAVGERRESTLAEGERTYWHIDIGDQKRVLVLVGADAFQAGLTLYDPDGIERATAWSASPEGGALLDLQRPGAGRYTLVMRARGGGGAYSLHILDPNE